MNNERTNMDDELATLKKEVSELKRMAEQNSFDVVSFGSRLNSYESGNKETIRQLNHDIELLQSDILKLEKEREEVRKEEERIGAAKSAMPNKLTYKEVCALVGMSYFNETTFKYYLFEQGLLDMKINKIRNTYRIAANYDSQNNEIKKYISICSNKGDVKVFMFDPGIVNYLKRRKNELNKSIFLYRRKSQEFITTREKLENTEMENFRLEVNRICGTGYSYDANKWAAIYHKYEIDHPEFEKSYNAYARLYQEEHPNVKYPLSKIKYLVNVCRDGDVILRIACELFVK